MIRRGNAIQHPKTRRSVVTGLIALGVCATRASAGQSILIAAASDLQAVMPELLSAFRAASGGEARVAYGATGNLARQIRQGAPFDVFLAADESFIQALARDGVIADAGAPYARGRMVLAVSRRSAFAETPTIEALATAARAGQSFRLAIANPEHAPYGQRAMEALTSQGFVELFKPRLVYGENVAQALQFVTTGAVAAGLVGSSVALAMSLRDSVTTSPIPEAWHQPLIQRLAVTRRGGEPAQRFAQFMESEAARAILTQAGFGLPAG